MMVGSLQRGRREVSRSHVRQIDIRAYMPLLMLNYTRNCSEKTSRNHFEIDEINGCQSNYCNKLLVIKVRMVHCIWNYSMIAYQAVYVWNKLNTTCFVGAYDAKCMTVYERQMMKLTYIRAYFIYFHSIFLPYSVPMNRMTSIYILTE